MIDTFSIVIGISLGILAIVICLIIYSSKLRKNQSDSFEPRMKSNRTSSVIIPPNESIRTSSVIIPPNESIRTSSVIISPNKIIRTSSVIIPPNESIRTSSVMIPPNKIIRTSSVMIPPNGPSVMIPPNKPSVIISPNKPSVIISPNESKDDQVQHLIQDFREKRESLSSSIDECYRYFQGLGQIDEEVSVELCCVQDPEIQNLLDYYFVYTVIQSFLTLYYTFVDQRSADQRSIPLGVNPFVDKESLHKLITMINENAALNHIHYIVSLNNMFKRYGPRDEKENKYDGHGVMITGAISKWHAVEDKQKATDITVFDIMRTYYLLPYFPTLRRRFVYAIGVDELYKQCHDMIQRLLLTHSFTQPPKLLLTDKEWLYHMSSYITQYIEIDTVLYILLTYQDLGFYVLCYVGITLTNANDIQRIPEKYRRNDFYYPECSEVQACIDEKRKIVKLLPKEMTVDNGKYIVNHKDLQVPIHFKFTNNPILLR